MRKMEQQSTVGNKANRIWCPHIKFAPFENRWWVMQGWLAVPRSWKVCPICKADRPKTPRMHPMIPSFAKIKTEHGIEYIYGD
jgi:hypothetical protein